MPHKHTRKGEDKSTVNLPPTTIARPLPVSKSAAANGVFTSTLDQPPRSNKKRKRKDDADDTPKAFARLMAFKAGKKLPKGLDDGVRESKQERKKRKATATATAAHGQSAADVDAEEGEEQEGAQGDGGSGDMPRIRPGERMSEFSARVDAALPVSGLINRSAKNGKDPLGLRVGRTKTEKRMHRMYDEWREQDRKIKERREEALERAEEEAVDDDGQVRWKADLEAEGPASTGSGKKKGSKKNKRKKVLGEHDDGEEDPWARLKSARGEAKVGLNDVVQAPPTFKSLPREKFKVRGARVEVEDVPKASGSLRRREELGEVRRSVVESYRAMMKKGKEE